MKITKMQGAGNDFLLVNNRKAHLGAEEKIRMAKRLCQRRVSFGADGMIFLEGSEKEFSMDFYNADGTQGELCGNGARCLARFAWEEGIAGEHMIFSTYAGLVEARRIQKTIYEVRMPEASIYREMKLFDAKGAYIELGNPGVPHFCQEVEEIDETKLLCLAKTLRHLDVFPKGANINFYRLSGEHVQVLTYERGVEGFTLACGSGVTSVFHHLSTLNSPINQLDFDVPGGRLRVYKNEEGQLMLQGPVLKIYTCELIEESVTE